MKGGRLHLYNRRLYLYNNGGWNTDFENAFGYFKLTRDTRVLILGFSYRFGKSFKAIPKRTGTTDEMERVGTGS